MAWPDGWTVLPVQGLEVEASAGSWHAHCSWPTRGGENSIVTVLRVQDTDVRGPGILIPPTRINILSSSARDGIVRSAHLKGDRRDQFVAWMKVLIGILDSLYRNQQPVRKLNTQAAPQPLKYLLYPIWPATGATGVAAAQGSLKSYSAVAVALSVATGTEVLQGNTRPTTSVPVLYLDWEADYDEMRRRMNAVTKGTGIDPTDRVHYLELRLPLPDIVGDLMGPVSECGAVVIDSMSAAIGGSMIDDDRVNAFWDAVRVLGVPAMVIAHKSAENQRLRTPRFFGSVMSEARVRMAWNVEREPDSSRVVWECFKDNNGRHLRNRLAWEWSFTSEGVDESETLFAVSANALNPANINLKPEVEGSVADEIAAVLVGEGPQTPKELAMLLGRTEQTIRTQLNRHQDRFVKASDGLRWQTRTQTSRQTTPAAGGVQTSRQTTQTTLAPNRPDPL